MHRCALLTVLAAVIVFAPGIAWSAHDISLDHVPLTVPLIAQYDSAGTIRPGGPPSNFTAEQRHNFYLGQLSRALEICGYYSLSSEVTAFRTDMQAFRRGEATLAGADSMSSCTSVKRAAEGFLSRVSPSSKSVSPAPAEIESYDPPASVKAKDYTGLYSFNGSTLTGGYIKRGDMALLLERRANRCRIEIPYARGWVDCSFLIIED